MFTFVRDLATNNMPVNMLSQGDTGNRAYMIFWRSRVSLSSEQHGMSTYILQAIRDECKSRACDRERGRQTLLTRYNGECLLQLVRLYVAGGTLMAYLRVDTCSLSGRHRLFGKAPESEEDGGREGKSCGRRSLPSVIALFVLPSPKSDS